MANKKQEVRPGWQLVYCRYIRNRRTGKIVYPKNGTCFRFWVRDK